ncbi:hypothetical protein, partial [Kocuria sabuli]|uniref:hypothetical protein n=1 Tax=Kocuria sabuli TaxID=3071448 RepID=UPI0034D68F98
RSATARRIARTAVGRWRLPGTRYVGPAPAGAALTLLTDPAGRSAAGEIDDALAVFPGLTGAHPLRTALGAPTPRPGLHATTPTSWAWEAMP